MKLFNPLAAYFEYRLRCKELDLQKSQIPYQALVTAVQSQSEVLNKWMDSFKVTELPTTSVQRDKDEFEREQGLDRIGVSADEIQSMFPQGL